MTAWRWMQSSVRMFWSLGAISTPGSETQRPSDGDLARSARRLSIAEPFSRASGQICSTCGRADGREMPTAVSGLQVGAV